MNELSQLSKRMVVTIGILFLIFLMASLIYYRSLEFLPFALGALLGCGLSVVKVLTLARTVDKAVDMEIKSAGNYVRLQYFLRMLLTAALLVLAALVPWISLWGAAAGIFAFQIAMYTLRFASKTEGR